MSKLQKSGTPQSMLSRSRANSASLAFRRGDVQISDPIPFSGRNDEPSFPQPPFSSVHLHSDNSLRRAQTSRNGSLAGRSMNDRSHADFTPRQSPPRLQHKRSMNGLREASNPTRSRASRSLTRSYQTLTPQDYRKSSPPNTTLRPKREKSTLKTVMRRLFGKKPAQTRRAARTGPPEHHRSVSAHRTWGQM